TSAGKPNHPCWNFTTAIMSPAISRADRSAIDHRPPFHRERFMAYETLHVAVDDRVGTITFNRPERMNAFNERLIEELPAAIRALDIDESVRIIIVTGAGGKAFSAGYDLKDSADRTEATLRELNDKYALNHEFTMSLWHCSKPIIAMIDGYCLAGALELALCCDIRYCSDTSQIGVLEARCGGG